MRVIETNMAVYNKVSGSRVRIKCLSGFKPSTLQLLFIWLCLAAVYPRLLVEGAKQYSREELEALPVKKIRSVGDDFVMQKNYDKALEAFTLAIEKEPENEKNYYKRVKVHEKTKSFGKALQDLNRALEINNEYTNAFSLRARIYMNLGKCSDAVADYETVLKLKPTHGDAKKQLPKATACARDVEKIELLVERYEI